MDDCIAKLVEKMDGWMEPDSTIKNQQHRRLTCPSHQKYRYHVPKYTNPLKGVQFVAQNVLFHEGDKDNAAAS